ncbi:MAG: hypothetical protein ACYDC3_02760 [Candidatus Binataceae bacterium]
MAFIEMNDSRTRWLARAAKAGRVLIGLLMVIGVLYLIDDLSIRYKIPAAREAFGSVRINKFLAVPLKSGKTQYILSGSENQVCLNSPFPHLGREPCWYLERHKDRRTDL